MKYKWLVKEYERVASAESVAKELKRIYLVNGRLSTLDMLASASFPGSPLHPLFTRRALTYGAKYELEMAALRFLCALVDEKGRAVFVRDKYGFKPAHYNKKIASIMSGGELIERVREKTGLYCDGGYIARIFRGERNAPKIVTAIKEILELEEDV